MSGPQNIIQERQDSLIQEFNSLNSWEDRYKRIIEYGKNLPDMSDQLKTEDSKVKGCQSQVWMHASLNEKNEMLIVADSDALLVKGLVALLVKVYSPAAPQDVLNTAPAFLKTLGFEENLSPNRTNGLHSMLKQIKMFATAFSYLIHNKK